MNRLIPSIKILDKNSINKNWFLVYGDAIQYGGTESYTPRFVPIISQGSLPPPEARLAGYSGLSYRKNPGERSPILSHRKNIFALGYMDSFILSDVEDIGQVCAYNIFKSDWTFRVSNCNSGEIPSSDTID